MSDAAPAPDIPPGDFEPGEFGRVIVTRMLTDTCESWAETWDIVPYPRKNDLAFALASLAAGLVEQLAKRDGMAPLEWWQQALVADARMKGSE